MGIAGFARGAASCGSGTPLAHDLPWRGRWLIAVVFAAPAVAALVAAQRTRRAGAGRHGGDLRRRRRLR